MDTNAVRISVVIPSFGRPEKVAACVRSLREQSLGPGGYEVLVGLDGADERSEASARGAWGDGPGLSVVTLPRMGQAGVRNALLKRAEGGLIVFLNDDVVAERDLLEAHGVAHQESAGDIVVGSAPFAMHARETLFDRLIRETSMVFFYNRMDSAEGRACGRSHDWGFRHAWMINLSVSRAMIQQAGGISQFPETYGYEDDEFAWRVCRQMGARVLYRPEAKVTHQHRYSPESYLQRETGLGRAAWGFAMAAPECARELFGRDVTADGEVAYSDAFVRNERRGVERLRESFASLATIPADSVPEGAHADTLLNLIYEQHLLLKRYCWRQGHLDAALGGAAAQAA